MGVDIEFFSSNEKNQGIQIGCPDLLWSVLAKKMCRFSYSFYDIFTFDLLYLFSIVANLVHHISTEVLQVSSPHFP